MEMTQKRIRELRARRTELVGRITRDGRDEDSGPDPELNRIVEELDRLEGMGGGRIQLDFDAERARLARIESEDAGAALARQADADYRRRASMRPQFRSDDDRRRSQEAQEAEVRRGKAPARRYR